MEVRLHRWQDLGPQERRGLLRRAEAEISEEVMAAARRIVEDVRREGDRAVLRHSERFDGVARDGRGLRVGEEELATAGRALGRGLKQAIAFAVENVRRFHETQRPRGLELHEIRPGVFAGERLAPVPAVGLYVPRGRGSFPSVVYMQAIPARIAGVPRLACISPPDRQGDLDQASLYAARLCGLREIYRVGGVQGIAALAFGTESIPAVDKILGPGSVYVAAAKRLVREAVDVGFPAGPSEALILADAGADPRLVALDLITEAEHGADSSAFLVTPEEGLAEEVRRLLPAVIDSLEPRRAQFVRQVLAGPGGFGGIVLTPTLDEAVEFVNRFAPEHLQVACREPLTLLGRLHNAGEILLGQHTAFSMANYAAGCNNVIPTGGWARSCSPMSVREFLKASSVVYVGAAGAEILGPPVAALADYEGFSAHAQAVRARAPAVPRRRPGSGPPASGRCRG